MDYGSLALLALSVASLRFFQKFLSTWWRRQLPFPPGPSPYPIIGNFRDIPTKLPWLIYRKWGVQYGSDIVHASVLGQHIVIVNSVKTAVEIFEKRGDLYSGRPVLTMIELMGWDFAFSMFPGEDKWRDHRKMFHQHFRPDVSRIYHPIQIEKVHLLLQDLLSSPQEFREHLRTLAAAIIMATVYGYEVRPTNDYFVGLAEDAIKRLSDSFFPGAVAVNTFPILRYLPSWMPGAGFQRFAAECRQLIKEMREAPFEFVKQNMRDGTDSTSVVARLLENDQYDEDTIKDVAGSAYAGGADTIVSCLASFFLAMALYPDVQKKAQTEIDTVIGTDRLPDFEDRPSLPFVEALYREVMRWKPVTTLGMAHASTADDVYDGYFIPKGTMVISNIW
ncbi:O-methylsterigmatocystin oxidoreductase [Mycena sanguinolenta]|uniref:O-methylsterigmatocystin oxidoreductase n=1 Tax=Mycena sanguinolenta TaxID=230812 RepID=A0A8H6ZF96_9AGAR|nr:O-methylsterigmatocystin oxidoreductase [Mycena sanguinolenta]